MHRLSTFLLVWMVGLVSCKDGSLEKTNNFDQRPFLANMGTNIILPAYQSLAEQNELLVEAVGLLKDGPTPSTLLEVQVRLKAARMAWQKCTPFLFGPAEEFGLSAELNIYPIDRNQIAQNISSGNYNLSTLSNADAKGYQTIGFFVHGDPDSQEDILGSLTTGRLDYLVEVANRISATSQEVYEAWSADGGNYLATFTAESALGVDVGSSVGRLVNAMNRDFERNTRDGKIGIPVGIRSLGEPIPTASEAYFAGYSVELLKANIEGYKELYFGGEGIGFDDYLEEIKSATTGNEQLAETIANQFQNIEEAIEMISDPLPLAIQNQKSDVEGVFAEMQVMVALFKTDMASSIGVIISYQDTDGD